MTVFELSQDQLDELKSAMFWDDELQWTTEEQQRDFYARGIQFAGDLTNEDVYATFAGIDFTPDDFGCTASVNSENGNTKILAI